MDIKNIFNDLKFIWQEFKFTLTKLLNNVLLYLLILLFLVVYISNKFPIVEFQYKFWLFNNNFINFIVNSSFWGFFLFLISAFFFVYITYKRNKYKNKYVFLPLTTIIDIRDIEKDNLHSGKEDSFVEKIIQNKFSLTSSLKMIVKKYSQFNKNIVLGDDLLTPTQESFEFYCNKFDIQNFIYFEIIGDTIQLGSYKKDAFINNINVFLKYQISETEDLSELYEIYMIWQTLMNQLESIPKDENIEIFSDIIDSLFKKVDNYKNFYNYGNSSNIRMFYFFSFYMFLLSTALEFIVLDSEKWEAQEHIYINKYLYYLDKLILLSEGVDKESILNCQFFRELSHLYNYALFFGYYLIETKKEKLLQYSKDCKNGVTSAIEKAFKNIFDSFEIKDFPIINGRYFKWIGYIIQQNGIQWLENNNILKVLKSMDIKLGRYINLKMGDIMFLQIYTLLNRKYLEYYKELWVLTGDFYLNKKVFVDGMHKSGKNYKNFEKQIVSTLHDLIMQDGKK